MRLGYYAGYMMKLYIKEVATAKGYRNAKALADAMSEHFGVGVSYTTIYPLWNDEAKLWSRATFDRLCEFLNVPAGLLIQHVPGEGELPGESKVKRGKGAKAGK